MEVSHAWHELLTSESFRMKGKSVFLEEEMLLKFKLALLQGNVEVAKRLLKAMLKK